MQILKSIVATFICGSFLFSQDGSDIYRVGKIHTSAPIVHHTNFATTQIFSLNNINNRTRDITRSGSYRLSYSDTYAPTGLSTGNPMIRVKTSTIEIDLNGMEIVCNDTSGTGYVGIEIGTPPSLGGTQPTNVVIKNGSLNGFDCGILIHSGVKNVMLENIQIVNSSVGVVCMGRSGAFDTKPVVSVICDNVRVLGHGLNRRTALVNLKTLLETTYSYGSGNFMPLRADPINADTLDVYTYFGILAIYVSDLFIVNSCVQGVGYGTYDEGNGNRTEGIGIALRNCTRVGLQSSYVDLSLSQTKAVGLQIEATNDIELQDCQFGSNASQTQALGLELFTAASPTYIVESMKISNCEFNLNYSDATAIGANLSKIRDLEISGTNFCRNNGLTTCYGLYSTKMNYAKIIDTTCSANFANGSSAQTANGALAAGVYLQYAVAGDLSSITFENVQASSNIGTNSGRGIYINGANSVSLSHVICSLNQGTSLRTSEATDLIGTTSNVAGFNQSTSVISKHLGVLTTTGGVGLWLQNVNNCLCTDVAAVYNQGIRATGILGRTCTDCTFIDCNTSSQQSTGACFSSTLASQSPTALSVTTAQRQLLYGGLSISTISSKYATDKYLTSMGTIKTSQLVPSALVYTDLTTISSAMALLQAGVARYRLWGTAVGLHLHNSSGCLVDRHRALRNTAPKDSAMGVAFTGEVQACTVRNSDLSYNVGWTDSIRTNSTQSYNYTFDMTQIYPFWDMLASPGAGDGVDPTVDGTWGYASTIVNTPGFYISGGVFSAQGEFIKIQLDTTARKIVNLVGPATIGCLVGDAALDVLVENNLIQGNNGHSGQAYGILLDVGFAVVMKNNRVYSTATNSYGFGVGIFDKCSHSASVQIQNESSGNRSGAFYNANYMILYNPNDTPSFTFQTISSYNGDLSAAIDLLNGPKNFEINYVARTGDTYFYNVESTTDPILDTTLTNRWTSDANDWTA